MKPTERGIYFGMYKYKPFVLKLYQSISSKNCSHLSQAVGFQVKLTLWKMRGKNEKEKNKEVIDTFFDEVSKIK